MDWTCQWGCPQFLEPPGTSIRQVGRLIEPNPEHRGIPVSPAQDSAFRDFFRMPAGGHFYVYPVAAQAKMGEALAAVTLTQFFTKAGIPVRAMQSRFGNWETMRQENVVLLGHADSSQWIEPVLRAAPFRLAPTDSRRRARILNSRPRAGEQPEYLPTLPDATKSFALLSMLPGVDRRFGT